MIIKGSSRGSPGQLARHLLRTDTTEHVKILEIQSPHDSLKETFRDWQFLTEGTQGSRGLYHANIDPHGDYAMTPEQWQRSVEVLEKQLGLEGQPRAVVLHEKHGREHIHVVWQRTDIDTMTLRSDSWNYLAHERASMALEKEFGHEHVPGKHAKRDREQQPEFPRQEFNHAEWQQGERTGIDPREFKAAITALYAQSDNGQAFKAALEEKGYVLARGDRRDYVIVDEHHQVYSLARQIKGVNAKELREFMADIDRNMIPTIDQAKALQDERPREPEKSPRESPEAPQPPASQPESPAPDSSAKQDLAKEEIAALETALKERHAEEGRQMRLRQEAEYEQTARVLAEEAQEKLGHFDALQQAAREQFFRDTYRAQTGIAGFIEAIKERLNPQLLADKARDRKDAKDAFLRRQEKARADRVVRLTTERETDLAELTERHEQQRREHDAKYEQERDRYLREREAAARLLAEIEERRRLEQQLKDEHGRGMDGPDPPTSVR